MRFRCGFDAFLMLALAGYTFLENGVSSLRCYVCDSDKNNSTSCDSFDPSSENFAKECPPNKSAACLTTVLSDGRVTLRDCESRTINDCSKANDVEYCYCMENLCNGKWAPDTDDEDDTFEGSGYVVTVQTVALTTQNPKVTAVSTARFLKTQVQIVVFTSAAQYFLTQYYC